MAQYIVRTPKNPDYDGVTYGVRFRKGEAFVNKHTISKTLGWSLEQVIQKIGSDYPDYEIKEVLGEEDHAPSDNPATEKTKKVSEKTKEKEGA